VSTLYRLKAYFGMVPAEDMDAYLGYDESEYYDEPVSGHAPGLRGERMDAVDRRQAAPSSGAFAGASPHHSGFSRSASTQSPSTHLQPTQSSQASHDVGGRIGGGRSPVVHGSLAVDPPRAEPTRSTLSALAPPLTEPANAPPEESRRLPLSRITTVHPRSYNEARTIGERYRDGIPVIINLTELDDAAAKRLVDFAAGLAFALRGSIDKVTSRVFLLSPSGVEVSAEDRRRLAESGFFRQD
jgi:cell division inhibitor SepF